MTGRPCLKGPNANAPRRGTKGRQYRFVEYDEELAAWFDEFAPAAVQLAEPERPAFQNHGALPGPNPLLRWISNAIREEWNRAAKALGLEGIPMYEGTKHSSATDALRRGASLEAVQGALGHADKRSTRHYAEWVNVAPVSVMRATPIVPSLYGDKDTDGNDEKSEVVGALGEGAWRGGRDSNPQLLA